MNPKTHTPKFEKTLRKKDTLLGLSSGDLYRIFLDTSGEYLNLEKPISQADLLCALSQAYALGFEAAQAEATEHLRRMIYERRKPYSPTAKISVVTNLRK